MVLLNCFFLCEKKQLFQNYIIRLSVLPNTNIPMQKQSFACFTQIYNRKYILIFDIKEKVAA